MIWLKNWKRLNWDWILQGNRSESNTIPASYLTDFTSNCSKRKKKEKVLPWICNFSTQASTPSASNETILIISADNTG